MRIEVIDRLNGRTRCVLNLITPEQAEQIIESYQYEQDRAQVLFDIQPDRVPRCPECGGYHYGYYGCFK